MRHAALLAGLLLAGCATIGQVIPIGQEKYSIAGTDNSLTASLADLKANAYREAGMFCERQGKTFEILKTVDTPRAFGQMPQTEVQFTCVAKS